MYDILFKHGNTMIPRDASAEESKGDTAATLCLSNQKKRDSEKFNTLKCLWGGVLACDGIGSLVSTYV